MSDLVVIILTFNEEQHIARAIHSVQPIARSVVVVDSYSTDRTVDIARALGAEVHQHKFHSHASQFNWALDNVPISSQWIMRLDADEYIESDLAASLVETLPALPPDVAGINLKRKHIFMDRWIRHGGRYPLIMLRIWRTGAARVEDRMMDEHVVLSQGRTITLDGGFADHNLNDLTFFIKKHNDYATREAIEIINQKREFLGSRQKLVGGTVSRQTAITRSIKERFFNRIPFPLGVIGYFCYRYIVRLGFLDGMPGLIYHFLQGFWYRFLVGAKVIEYERALKDVADPGAVRAELSRMTGITLDDSSRAGRIGALNPSPSRTTAG
jgi:glycosyltransferase involved in cell wall biosynthesis